MEHRRSTPLLRQAAKNGAEELRRKKSLSQILLREARSDKPGQRRGLAPQRNVPLRVRNPGMGKNIRGKRIPGGGFLLLRGQGTALNGRLATKKARGNEEAKEGRDGNLQQTSHSQVIQRRTENRSGASRPAVGGECGLERSTPRRRSWRTASNSNRSSGSRRGDGGAVELTRG